MSFTVNSFLPYLRLTVNIFQFLRLSTKLLAVLRLSVNPIETLLLEPCHLISERGPGLFLERKVIIFRQNWKEQKDI